MNELNTTKGLAVAVESLIRRVDNLEEELESVKRNQEERELDALLEELLAEQDPDEVPPNCDSD